MFEERKKSQNCVKYQIGKYERVTKYNLQKYDHFLVVYSAFSFNGSIKNISITPRGSDSSNDGGSGDGSNNNSDVEWPGQLLNLFFNRFSAIILFANKFVIITDNMITLASAQPSLFDVIKMKALKISMVKRKIHSQLCVCVLCVCTRWQRMLNHNTCNVEKWSVNACAVLACTALCTHERESWSHINLLDCIDFWWGEARCDDAPCIGCSKLMC